AALGRELVGDLPGGEGRHAGGAADQHGLLAREATGEGEGVGVGDLDDAVGHGPVVGLGPEVLADALDEVGAAGATGVDRAGRVGTDHLDVSPSKGGLLLEVAPD